MAAHVTVQGLGPRRLARRCASGGFTLLEIMIVVAILATLVAIGVPQYRSAVRVARQEVAVREVTLLQNEIDTFELRWGTLPLTLADVDRGTMLDPWGHPYKYLNFATITGGKGVGAKRKDRFLVPLNSTYDLYSMGPDGKSQSALTAQASQDDIIRANDGDYIGLASKY